MKDFEITIQVTEIKYDELSEHDRVLVEAAKAATFRSYSPYSHFSVGAAIRLANGEVVTGSNQENAAFSAGTCAERSACFYAGAQYPDVAFECIAIAARGTDGKFLDDPVSPCGVCRQALLEYEARSGAKITVLMVAAEKVYRLPSVSSLLPFAFVEF